jgi:hypothetical protein
MVHAGPDTSTHDHASSLSQALGKLSLQSIDLQYIDTVEFSPVVTAALSRWREGEGAISGTRSDTVLRSVRLSSSWCSSSRLVRLCIDTSVHGFFLARSWAKQV